MIFACLWRPFVCLLHAFGTPFALCLLQHAFCTRFAPPFGFILLAVRSPFARLLRAFCPRFARLSLACRLPVACRSTSFVSNDVLSPLQYARACWGTHYLVCVTCVLFFSCKMFRLMGFALRVVWHAMAGGHLRSGAGTGLPEMPQRVENPGGQDQPRVCPKPRPASACSSG